LWDGKDLFTKNIKEDVIMQNDRLAYTEITMDIACAEKVGVIKRLYIRFNFRSSSHLSLWVNGIERKEF
jgi:hypothetical protein